jgi:hypothetical protein
VKTYDDLIAQENDHLKREVKKLELEVNRSNVVKKLEKGKPHQRLFLNLQRSKFKMRRMKK